jgi:outer membrane protein OmpA-like peptidoglycan-associated protein
MFSSDDDNQGLVLGVLFGVIALVIALVIGVSIYTRNLVPAAKAPALAAAPAAAHGEAHGDADADGPSVKVENGVVKFYFVIGKADVAPGARVALVEVVRAVKVGKIVVISGFHDASGDAAKNAELARQRALAVRDALKDQGVAEDKIELKKPEETLASGPASEARRVEVTVK